MVLLIRNHSLEILIKPALAAGFLFLGQHARMPRTCAGPVLLLLSFLTCAQQGYISDHERTPGAINPDVTETKVCAARCAEVT